MPRLILTSVLVCALGLVVAGPALAASCPKLVGQITAAAGNRFDKASQDAKAKAAEADKLHKDGKHADSEKAAKDGLALLGIKS